jgi:hypothetical protein
LDSTEGQEIIRHPSDYLLLKTNMLGYGDQGKNVLSDLATSDTKVIGVGLMTECYIGIAC